MMIAAQSGNRDPMDDAYRAATPVFVVPVSRTSAAVSSDGLCTQGQVRCESCSTSCSTRTVQTFGKLSAICQDAATFRDHPTPFYNVLNARIVTG